MVVIGAAAGSHIPVAFNGRFPDEIIEGSLIPFAFWMPSEKDHKRNMMTRAAGPEAKVKPSTWAEAESNRATISEAASLHGRKVHEDIGDAINELAQNQPNWRK